MNVDYIFNENNSKLNCDDSFSVASFNFDKISPVDGLDADVAPEISVESDPSPYVRDISLGRKYKWVASRMAMKNVCFSTEFKEKLASLENVLGNFLISCKYAPNAKGKYASFISYAIDCDCPDCVDNNVAKSASNGSIDGFFNDVDCEKEIAPKVCKKTNLPVFDPVNFGDSEKADLFARVVKVYPIALKCKSHYDSIVDPIKAIKYLFNSLDNNSFSTSCNTKDVSKEYDLKDSDLNITVTSDIDSVNVEDYNGDVDGFTSVGDFDLNNCSNKMNVDDSFNVDATFDVNDGVVVDNSPVDVKNLVKTVDSIDDDFVGSLNITVDPVNNMNDIDIDPVFKDQNIDEKRGDFDF